jgi:hypothetical protein
VAGDSLRFEKAKSVREMRMRRLNLIALTLAVQSVLLLLSCRGNRGLLGTWTSVVRTKGGVATVVEFRPDGTFVSSYETMLDCSYRMQDGQLTLTATDPKTGQTSADLAEARVEGDTLVIKAPWDGTQYEMLRSGTRRPADPPIVGKWISGAQGARPARAEFTTDGKFFFRQRLKSASGNYTVSGDSLTLNFEGSPPQTGRFRIEGDSLVLTPDKGSSQTFDRARRDE